MNYETEIIRGTVRNQPAAPTVTTLSTDDNPNRAVRLHRDFVRYGSNAKHWTRRCALLLPEIEKHRVWEKKGFSSIYEYAAKIAGMGRNSVDDALWILRKIEDKPALQKIVAIKGINAVRPVVAIATKETDSFWAEKSAQMSRHTLETYVKELARENKMGEIPRTGTGNCAENAHQGAIEQTQSTSSAPSVQSQIILTSTPAFEQPQLALTPLPPQTQITMELTPEVADQLKKLKGSGDWNQLMKELLAMREAQMQEQEPEPVKTESKYIPVKIRRHVVARTNGTCAFPGCTKPHKILHHTQRFALEKTHDPARLVPLCENHERMVHLSLIENEDSGPAHWKVRLRPDESGAKRAVDLIVGRYRGAGV